MKKLIDGGEAKDNSLPRIPTITAEQQAEIDAEQEILAQKFDATGSFYNRALAVIGECEPIPLKDLVPIQRENYADALAEVGKFKEAAKITKDLEKRKYFKAINNAVWRNDEDRCHCVDTNAVILKGNQAEQVTHDRHFVMKEIFSEKHGKRMNLWKCNKCEQLNCR